MKYFGCEGSGEITASQTICSGAGFLTALMVYTDGTNDATVTLYDCKTGALGKVLVKLPIAGDNDYGGRIWADSAFRRFTDGIYAVVSGAGASAIVEYIKS